MAEAQPRVVFNNTDEVAWAAMLSMEVVIEMLVECGADEERIDRAFVVVTKKAADAGLFEATRWLHILGTAMAARRAARALERDPARGEA